MGDRRALIQYAYSTGLGVSMTFTHADAVRKTILYAIIALRLAIGDLGRAIYADRRTLIVTAILAYILLRLIASY